MSSYNDITGDKIQSRTNTKNYEKGYELWEENKRKEKARLANAASTADKPVEPADDWDEKRIDVIGTNGNDGLHYEGK